MADENITFLENQFILYGVVPTGKEIGRGAYGRVFEVDYEGTLCAAKEIHELLLAHAQGDALQKLKDDFIYESQIWSTLRHPNVVQFLGVHYSETNQFRLPVMIMEKMQQSLRGLVEKYDNIPLNVRLSMLHEVCCGLRYLHSRNPPIIHRDLTPNNILLGHCLEAKITDLGVAKVLQATNIRTMTMAPGTVDFMPPESLADRPVYGLPLDVFSFGGVVLFTITALWPQPASWVQFHPDTKERILVSEWQRRQRYLDKMIGSSADLKPLVISCLNDNPENRPLIAEVTTTIKQVKDAYSQKSNFDGMTSIAWWNMVSNEQQSTQQQQITSLTNQLQEMSVKTEELTKKITDLEEENMQLKDELSLNRQQVDMTEDVSTVNIEWTEGTAAPVSRVLHTAVLLNGVIYVGGCFHDAHISVLHRIDVYHIATDSWDKLPILTPYRYFAMTKLNDFLIAAGGQDNNKEATDVVLMLENGATELKEYATMMMPKYLVAAVGHQGMLIVAGGQNNKGNPLVYTEVLDSATRQWHVCSALPQACSWSQLVIASQHLYLIGGYGQDNHVSCAVYSSSLDSISKYYLNWESLEDLPCWFPASVSLDGTDLLIMGGLKWVTEGGRVRTSNIYMFNKDNNKWKVSGHIPLKRGAPAVISVDNKIIVIGGRNYKGEHTNTVWIGLRE